MNITQRAKRVHFKIKARSSRARLLVFRSNKYIYAQLNSTTGATLGTARDKSAKIAGEKIAGIAKKHKVTEIVFDRGGYQYHGRVKELAEAARETGLKF